MPIGVTEPSRTFLIISAIVSTCLDQHPTWATTLFSKQEISWDTWWPSCQNKLSALQRQQKHSYLREYTPILDTACHMIMMVCHMIMVEEVRTCHMAQTCVSKQSLHPCTSLYLFPHPHTFASFPSPTPHYIPPFPSPSLTTSHPFPYPTPVSHPSPQPCTFPASSQVHTIASSCNMS